jgi:Ni/Co efflux regulator RcnB
MKMTALALTTALLMAGVAATTASAQDSYEIPAVHVYANPYSDGNPYTYQPYSYSNYERTHRRGRVVADHDCDGIPDRFDHHNDGNVSDRDCDGVPNRYDHYDNHTYSARVQYYAPAYVEPYGYASGGRYEVGAYLPERYYESSYYIDYRPYGLAPPPNGYRWTRVGDDVYLVSTDNGRIAEVVFNLFR